MANLLNPIFLKDPKYKAIEKLLDNLHKELIEKTVSEVIYPRIDEIEDEQLLDLLGHQFHIEGFELAKSIEEKRALIKRAIESHRYKGTKYAVLKVLEALNLQGEVKEWFEYNGKPYRFKVYIDHIGSEELWEKLIKLINEYKNERSWLDGIGLHTETKGVVYLGTALKRGKNYTIGIHFEVPKTSQTTYIGTAYRKGRTTTIGVHKPHLEPVTGTAYVGTAYRKARIVSIYPA